MAQDNKFQFPVVARWIVSILVIGIIIYALWYFRYIVACLFLAMVLSFMGRPLMALLSKLKYKKLHIGNTLSASITLVVLVVVVFSVLYILIPVIVEQAMSFANLDINKIASYYAQPIQKVQNFLYQYQLIQKGTNLETMLSNKILDVFNMFNLTDLANIILSWSGKIILGFFITLFCTFFFLKDSHLLYNFIMGITPDEYMDEVDNIITSTRNLISRYFILTTGFYIAGFPNAILIACLCGVMVILPYIGVVIGGITGLMVCITQILSANPATDIIPIIITFAIIFLIVKLLDDFFLQPVIYSKSVKAHPLEIFLIILMAGEIGGVIGMILAIPAYTFLRIIAKEFFSRWKIVRKMTGSLDQK